MIPTPHINIKDKSKVAKTVLMPGDPLRAKYIAENFLTDVELVSDVRNMLAYTGTHKGKEITVMGSGMGIPSIGIYSYELYNFYDVDTIIRVGSAGAYTSDLKLHDVVLATSVYSESTYVKYAADFDEEIMEGSEEISQKIRMAADALDLSLVEGRVHSSDVFYRNDSNDYKAIFEDVGCICVEMEAYALFTNARKAGKNAATLLTISDSLVTKETTTSKEREISFLNMINIALEADVY